MTSRKEVVRPKLINMQEIMKYYHFL